MLSAPRVKTPSIKGNQSNIQRTQVKTNMLSAPRVKTSKKISKKLSIKPSKKSSKKKINTLENDAYARLQMLLKSNDSFDNHNNSFYEMLVNKDKFTNVNNLNHLFQRQQDNAILQGPSLYTSQISTGTFVKTKNNSKKSAKNSIYNLNRVNASSSTKKMSSSNVLKNPVLSNHSKVKSKSKKTSQKANSKSKKISQKANSKSKKISQKANSKSKKISQKANSKSKKISQKANSKSKKLTKKSKIKDKFENIDETTNTNTVNISSSIKNSTRNVLKVPVLSNLSDDEAKKLIDKELLEFEIKDNFENINDQNIFSKIYNNISYGLGKIFN
jgi:hypothetical protein